MRRLEDIYEDFEHEHSFIFRNAPAEFTLPEGGEAVLGRFTDWNGNAIQNDFGYFLPNIYWDWNELPVYSFRWNIQTIS